MTVWFNDKVDKILCSLNLIICRFLRLQSATWIRTTEARLKLRVKKTSQHWWEIYEIVFFWNSEHMLLFSCLLTICNCLVVCLQWRIERNSRFQERKWDKGYSGSFAPRETISATGSEWWVKEKSKLERSKLWNKQALFILKL